MMLDCLDGTNVITWVLTREGRLESEKEMGRQLPRPQGCWPGS